MAVPLEEAAKTFRELRSDKGMLTLVAAFRAHDSLLDPQTVDRVSNAA